MRMLASSSIGAQFCLLIATPTHSAANVRRIHLNAPLYGFKPGPTHCYDILEINAKATQSQIKSAFYRLSKVYHPDLNSEASVEKFREITEAYEILGNQISRKRYDKGVLNPLNRQDPNHHYQDTDDDYDKSFRHRHYKRRGPIMTGKTKHFDFDEFYRKHYGERVLKNFKQRCGQGRMSAEERFKHEKINYSEIDSENPTAHIAYIFTIAICAWFIGGLIFVDHAWVRKLEKPVDPDSTRTDIHHD